MTVDELRLYTLAEAAAMLHVTEDWYVKRLRARKLPGHKSGRDWTLSVEDIQAAKELMAVPAIVPKPDSAGLTPTSRRRLARRGGAR